ncbi:MAG: hypothetical protein AMJ53_02895 [Gammaproteobacteria bacterium SG8_11]|nr:MAG: hypothetical protein AMJ53_02895 [Gammaproteobacteria bacterium SG8_11]
MAAKYWLKLYYDMLDDPKIGKLRPALRWRFIECLLVAGECDDDGYIPDPAEYAWRVRADTETVETDFVQLAEGGLLSQNGGRWLVTKFSERQAPVPPTERWRQWRDRQRQQEYNEQQTDFKRGQTKVQTNRLTDIDIDTDIDKMQMKKGADAPGVNGGDILNQAASKALVDWWTRLTGGGRPWGNDAQADYYGPAETLLERLNNDVPRAKDLLEEKRAEMIRDGKTPKRLSAVAFYVVADLDGETIDYSSNIADFKVYNEPQT